MTELRITDIDNIEETAREFAGLMGDDTVFAFYGKMGVGKTTFIKALCKVLGVEDEVNSPTFAWYLCWNCSCFFYVQCASHSNGFWHSICRAWTYKKSVSN